MKNDKAQPLYFIGRDTIMASLDNYYHNPEPRLILVHGRRRVGKTRLIHEFTREKKNVFYFTGVEVLAQEKPEQSEQKIQIINFLTSLSQTVGKAVYAQVPPTSWSNALALLDECLPVNNEPCIVVLDELPWMAGNRLELVRALFNIWESRWATRRRLLLIVCGSSVGFLNKHFIRSTQFYGRASLSIHVPPLTIFETNNFFRGQRSPDDVLELSMTFGGIPKYLEQITPRHSSHLTINKLCFEPQGFFVEEIDLLLRSSFVRESEKYKHVLKALTKTESLDYETLARQTKSAKGSSFKNILDNLTASDMIERFTPIDKKHETNLIKFRLSDEFSRFFFTFVEPQLAIIRQNHGEHDLYAKALPERKYFSWRGQAFERLVQKHAFEIAKRTGIDFVVERFGSYFSRLPHEPQIDLMFVRTDKTITVCEVKCSNNPILMDKNLREQIVRQRNFLQSLFKGHRIEHWLITNTRASNEVIQSGLVQRVVTLSDLMKK